jgi:hypothetical protein
LLGDHPFFVFSWKILGRVFLILKSFHVLQEMLEAACMELCSPEDQELVRQSMSTPAMKGVELEVVVQKPGQVVKTMDPHVVLARGGTVRDSANFATCSHLKNVSMERQWSLREDRRRVSSCLPSCCFNDGPIGWKILLMGFVGR